VHRPGSGLCAMDEEVGYRGEEATAPAATRRIGPQHAATATCKRGRKMRERWREGRETTFTGSGKEDGKGAGRTAVGGRPRRASGPAVPHSCWGPPRLRGWRVGSAVGHRRSQHAAGEGGIAGHKHRRRRLQASVHLELKVAARIWLAADLGGGAAASHAPDMEREGRGGGAGPRGGRGLAARGGREAGPGVE
jgi:hypothetical protein